MHTAPAPPTFIQNILSMKSWFRSLGNLTDRIICVVAAVVLLQAPIYMNQYQNVLAGAQQEAALSFNSLAQIAADFDQTLREYLDELLANDNPKVVANAEEDDEKIKRYESYTASLEAFQQANVFSRPFVFLGHYEQRLANAVEFQPGLPITMEGFVYALLGIVIAMLLIGLLKRLFGLNKPEKQTI